jgi:5-carboxymethyl-2-hydroxymuconate isomerase
MPHFILDCSARVLEGFSEEQIIEQVHLVANSTQLFEEDDIKVRVNPYQTYSLGNKKQDFIHVFAYIMEGRSTEQKADLSKRVVQTLASMFPKISKIAMNVYDFEKATYCNRDML